MTERDARLVKEFGPRFIARNRHILNECLHLASDACSTMTDEEWENCAKAMDKFEEEMRAVQELVSSKIMEAVGGDEDKYMELYVKAKESLGKFSRY